MSGDSFLELDASELKKLGADLREIEPRLNDAVSKLAAQTHLHILEQVQQKLHSRRQMYVDALVKPQEVSKGVYVIVLEAEAAWIEDGLPEYFMGDTLLKGPGVKRAADGSMYRVIPFEHSGAPNAKTEAGKSLTDTLKTEMKKRKIPWSKIETDPSGSPKQGLIHKFDIPGAPTRPSGTAGKPGWGKGPEGAALQGPTGTPFLQGVRVYQSPMMQGGKPVKDKKGDQKFKKSVMTFRIISSKHKGTGRWQFPGIEGMKFFDDAEQWAGQQWDQHIIPEIAKDLGLE
jgi:hypothetical protein